MAAIDIGISAFMDEDWLGQIAKYAGRTGYVHLKDWAFGKYCILGEGTKGIDWSAVLAAFTATGFDGCRSRNCRSPLLSCRFTK